jgi:hypothetical protein
MSERPRLPEDEEPKSAPPRGIRSVRLGHGANCSSIGSVVDVLFATAAIGSAVFAAVAAAMATERIRVVGERRGATSAGTGARASADADASSGADADAGADAGDPPRLPRSDR